MLGGCGVNFLLWGEPGLLWVWFWGVVLGFRFLPGGEVGVVFQNNERCPK
jgi:hypothetical protein